MRIQDVIGRLGCRMELMFSDDRRLIRSTTYNLMRGGEKVFHEAFDPSKPAVINNSLIPAEWINVPLEWGKTMTREYKIKRQIGPASFLKTVRLTFEPVLLSGILNENMVTSALMDDLNDRRLLLVRLENVIGDGGEEIIFLQLWAEGIPFWIYEKTSSRQSWLLSAKY
ncbi:MAG TPA: hypothetical protein EYP57_03390 [Thermodesulfobacteriaceae bacterium]|nr:hypothetical protein [Thermodesulfobacteriaceae bacterium]